MALRTAIGDKWGCATALHKLGTIAAEQGEHGRAIALYEESLSLRRKLGDRHGIAVCLEGLVGVAVAQDDVGTGSAALRDGGSTADPDWCSRVTPGACQI